MPATSGKVGVPVTMGTGGGGGREIDEIAAKCCAGKRRKMRGLYPHPS